MARKPGRPKSGAEILSRQHILVTALALVDTFGMEALSMRRLAKELGVDPMAIYRHLPDKAAVIEGIVALVISEFAAPNVTSDDWRDQVRAFAAAYRALVWAHPNVMYYLLTHIEASPPAVLALSEYLAATLQQIDLTPLQVVTAVHTLVDSLHGYVLTEISGRMGQPGHFGDFYALLDALPHDRYPAMRAAYGALDEATLQAHAHDELELILAGIAAWIRE